MNDEQHKMILFTLALLLLSFLVSGGTGVKSTFHTKGRITPVDPVLEVGQPLRFNCTIFCDGLPKDVNCNISNVFITFRGLKPRGLVIQAKDDDRVQLTPKSSTILEYYNPKVELMDEGSYLCFIHRDESDKEDAVVVDASHVHIRLYPVKVPKTLDCRSPNWNYMKCSWDCSKYPSFGPKRVNWNVTYTYTRDSFTNQSKSPEGRMDSCSFTIPPEDFLKLWAYFFTITARSGTRKEIGTIRIYASPSLVVPKPVLFMNIVDVTATSMTLEWGSPMYLEPEVLPLIYEVHGKSRLYGDIQSKILSENCSTCRMEMTNLVPYTTYTFWVRSKPWENGQFWSNETFVKGMTDTSVPGRNPATAVGGFKWETDTRGDGSAILYFQDIPPRYAHGAITGVEASFKKDPGYSFTVACDHKRRECHLTGIESDRDYVITIEASTLMGYGPIKPTSAFHMLPVKDAPAPPDDLTAEIYNKTANEASIHFSWSNETVSPDTSYTLFYRHCTAGDCKGGLQWEKFNGNTNSYNLTINHEGYSISDYSFAIAVNKGLYTKGMSDWVTCLYDYHKPPSKAADLEIMEREVQEEKSLKVKWESTPCSKGAGRILRYEIVVMELDEHAEPTGVSVTYFVPARKNMFKIPDLKLGTEYGITLRVVGRTGRKESQQIIGSTIPPPENPVTMPIIIITVCLIVIIIIVIVVCSYRYYRKLMDTPVSINVPRGNGIIASFDYHQEEAEEFVDDPIVSGDEAENSSDTECSPILSPKKKMLDTHRQLSRDSGTESMVSNTTKDSINHSDAGTDSVNNSLEAVSEEGEDEPGSGNSRRSRDDPSGDKTVTQLPTSQGYCVVGLTSPHPDILRDIQAYGPGPPQNNVFTVGCVQFENPNFSRSLAKSEESMDFKPVHSSSRGTSSNSLETLTTPSPLPVIRQLQKNYLPDLGYGTDDSGSKAKARQQLENAKKEAESRKLKENPLKKNKDFSSLGSVCSSSSFEESYSKLAMRNMPKDDSAINNNVAMDDKNIRKVGSLNECSGKPMPAVLPVKAVMINDGDIAKGGDQARAFVTDSCGNSLADTNSDSCFSLGSDPKASPPLPNATVQQKAEPCPLFDQPGPKMSGGYVQRPDTLVGTDANGFVVNLRDRLGGDTSEDDTCSDSISPYSKLGISPDMVDLNAMGPCGNYMPNSMKNIQPMAGKNGYVDLPILNNAVPAQRTSVCDDMSDTSSQSDFSVEDCQIDLKALGLNTGDAAVLPLETGLPHSDFNNKMCNGYIQDTDIDKTTCV